MAKEIRIHYMATRWQLWCEPTILMSLDRYRFHCSRQVHNFVLRISISQDTADAAVYKLWDAICQLERDSKSRLLRINYCNEIESLISDMACLETQIVCSLSILRPMRI